MCGGSDSDLYDPRRFGALAVISPSSALENASANLSGQIVFFNASDHKSPVATHVSFTPNHSHTFGRDLVFTIFSSGDLTMASTECTRLDWFTLSGRSWTANRGGAVQSKLDRNLLLQVGGNGIIGRRIAISTLRSPSCCVAEGIVGFNSGASLPPSARMQVSCISMAGNY